MTIGGDLDYAHARLCARFGERPDEIAWRSIEAIRGLPALLGAARNLPFRRWLVGITADADPHTIEAALVEKRRTLVNEVAQWMPARWQPAVAWAGVLAELPVVEHLARGGEALPWMRKDAVYGSLCNSPGPPVAGPLAPLAAGWQRPDGLFPVWHKEWTRRVPEASLAAGEIFNELSRALTTHRPVAGASLAGASLGATAMRGALAARLALLFRRATLDPAAAFIFLALSALDLERLRGELLRRAIFPTARLAA